MRRNTVDTIKEIARDQGRLIEADVIGVDIQTRRATVRLAGSSHTSSVGLGPIDPDSVLDGRARLLLYLSPYGGIFAVSVIGDKPVSASKPAVTLGDKHGASRWQILDSQRNPVFWIDSLGRVSFAGSYISYGWTPSDGGSGLGSEPYVTMALSGNLDNERVLTAGAGITLADGGADGNATIGHDSGNFGDVHTNYAEPVSNESITGAWDFRAAGLTIGTDVLLYRSAASLLTLGSDDDMCIQGRLRVGSLGAPSTDFDLDGSADISGTVSIGGDVAVDGDTLYVDVSEDAVYINPFSGTIPPTLRGALTVSPATTTQRGLVLQQLASQTAYLLQVFDSAGSDLLLITNDGSVESGNPGFVSGISGWQLNPEGDAEFHNVWVRGELHASMFVSDEISASNGSLLIGTSGIVYDEATLPAALNQIFELNITATQESGLCVFVSGDVLRVKTLTGTSGALDIYDIYAEVNSIGSLTGRDIASGEPGYYPLRCFWRSGGAASIKIPGGSTAVWWGSTAGSVGDYGGQILITADLNDAPYMDILTLPEDHAFWPFPPAATARVRLGNLDGVLGLAEQWGIAASSNLSDNSLPHVILSDLQLALYGVAQTWWDTDGNARGEVDPTADSTPGTTDTLFWLGPSESGAQFKVFGDGQVWMSTLAISEDSTKMFFSRADGLLLLGPSCEINSSSWISTRGQVATLTGAIHRIQGAWPGTNAIVVECATENLCENPSVEVDTTGWAGINSASISQSSAYSMFGNYSLRVIPAANPSSGARYNPDINISGSTEYTLSAYVYATISDVDMKWGYATDVGGFATGGTFTTVVGWQRVSVTFTSNVADTKISYFQIYKDNDANTNIFFIDGVQVEEGGVCTSYCDGSLGSGYTWSGTEHDSSSVRQGTIVELDDHVYLVSNNTSFSVRAVVEVPYDFDGTWHSTGNCLVWRAYYDGSRYARVLYDPVAQEWKLELSSLVDSTSLGVTGEFSAGDKVDLLAVIDHVTDSHALYINGVEEVTDSTTIGATQFSKLHIGANSTTNHGNFAFTEFAIFDTALSANDAAALHAQNKPLVDAGDFEGPGIYILDGRFLLSSSTSGSCLTLLPDSFSVGESVGYDSGVGAWIGLDGGEAKLFVGDSTSHKILWNGSTLSVYGELTSYSGIIGGWTIDSDAIYKLSGGGTPAAPTTGIALEIDGGYNSGPIICTYDSGALNAAMGNYANGKYGIYAIEGSIGSWSIGSTAITSTNIILQSGAAAYLGVGNGGNFAGLAAGSLAGNILIWAGSNYGGRGAAPFRVQANGEFHAGDTTNYFNWDGTNVNVHAGSGALRIGQYGILSDVSDSSKSGIIWKDNGWLSTVGVVRVMPNDATHDYDMELICGDNNASVTVYPDWRVLARKTGGASQHLFEAQPENLKLGVWTSAPGDAMMHVLCESTWNKDVIFAQQNNQNYPVLHLGVPGSPVSWKTVPYLHFDGEVSEGRWSSEGREYYYAIRVWVTDPDHGLGSIGSPWKQGQMRIYIEE